MRKIIEHKTELTIVGAKWGTDGTTSWVESSNTKYFLNLGGDIIETELSVG